jgi:RNA polymerase sigma factor (TIGR02999 family)
MLDPGCPKNRSRPLSSAAEELEFATVGFTKMYSMPMPILDDADRPLPTPAKRSAEDLLPIVYAELRQLATARLAQERPGQTLQPTALVHEAYLRVMQPSGGVKWDNEGHFFAAAAEAMRRILVDRARSKNAIKRGGGQRRVDFDLTQLSEADEELLALNDALEALRVHNPAAVKLVELRYFAGLSHQEAAASLNLTRGAADRLWSLAKAWLYQWLQENS